jgi:hypothetical protein
MRKQRTKTATGKIFSKIFCGAAKKNPAGGGWSQSVTLKG